MPDLDRCYQALPHSKNGKDARGVLKRSSDLDTILELDLDLAPVFPLCLESVLNAVNSKVQNIHRSNAPFISA